MFNLFARTLCLLGIFTHSASFFFFLVCHMSYFVHDVYHSCNQIKHTIKHLKTCSLDLAIRRSMTTSVQQEERKANCRVGNEH